MPQPDTIPTNSLELSELETNLIREEARKRIEQEDNLINHRVSWLVSAQAFLLTAFVILKNNPEFYATNPAKPLPAHFIHETFLLAYLIFFAGVTLAASSFIGVCAALAAIQAWRRAVKQEIRIHLTSGPWLHFFGALPALLPGPVFVSIWSILYFEDMPATHISPQQAFVPWLSIVVSVVFAVYYSVKAYGFTTSFKEKG